MNPLSPFTYYLCHRRSALLQVTLVSLATATVFILACVLDTIPTCANVTYLTKLSRVIPTCGTLDPAGIHYRGRRGYCLGYTGPQISHPTQGRIWHPERHWP